MSGNAPARAQVWAVVDPCGLTSSVYTGIVEHSTSRDVAEGFARQRDELWDRQGERRHLVVPYVLESLAVPTVDEIAERLHERMTARTFTTQELIEEAAEAARVAVLSRLSGDDEHPGSRWVIPGEVDRPQVGMDGKSIPEGDEQPTSQPREARQRAIDQACRIVRSDTSGFASRAGAVPSGEATPRLTGGDWERRANEYWANWHRSAGLAAEEQMAKEVAEAERDRYREALIEARSAFDEIVRGLLGPDAEGLAVVQRAISGAETAQVAIDRALAGSVPSAPSVEGDGERPKHTDDCDGQRLSYHAATGDDMACVCGADKPAGVQSTTGSVPPADGKGDLSPTERETACGTLTRVAEVLEVIVTPVEPGGPRRSLGEERVLLGQRSALLALAESLRSAVPPAEPETPGVPADTAERLARDVDDLIHRLWHAPKPVRDEALHHLPDRGEALRLYCTPSGPWMGQRIPPVSPQAEPVAWRVMCNGEQIDLCTSEARAREVVAFESEGDATGARWETRPVYEHPPVPPAEHHDYSLVDAVLPAEGPVRDRLVDALSRDIARSTEQGSREPLAVIAYRSIRAAAVSGSVPSGEGETDRPRSSGALPPLPCGCPSEGDCLGHGHRGVPERCPDGGTCHHWCEGTCFRSETCAPLSAFGDTWPSTTPVDLAESGEGTDG